MSRAERETGPAGGVARADHVVDLDTPRGPGRAHVWAPDVPRASLVLSHGAGGGIDAIDLQLAREVFVAAGWSVALVEQPWRVAGRRVAGPPKALDEACLPMIEQLRAQPGDGAASLLPGPLVTGGRSAGARVACRTCAPLADLGQPVSGLLLFSFPLSPKGSGRSRADELVAPTVPVVVVQGERDPFGGPDEVRAALGSGEAAAGAAAGGIRAGGDVLGVPGAHSFPERSRDALRAALEHAQEILRDATGA